MGNWKQNIFLIGSSYFQLSHRRVPPLLSANEPELTLILTLQFNLLYVGGRPSTRFFRFRGNMSNIFLGSAPLTSENIATFHRQAFSGTGINPITIAESSNRYCTRYVPRSQQCFVNNFEVNDFR